MAAEVCSLPHVNICTDQLLHAGTAGIKSCVVGVPWEKRARERDFSNTGLPKHWEKKGLVEKNYVGALEPTAYNPLLVCRSPLPIKDVTRCIIFQ